MRFDEYRKHDAISLAELIAKRQISAEEVLEAAMARAEQINPVINAIVHQQYDQARKAIAAGLPEGPLKGVPYLFEAIVTVTFANRLGRSVRHGINGDAGELALSCVAEQPRSGQCLVGIRLDRSLA